MTGTSPRRRPRPLLAWLAIVALLIDALMPSAFAASLAAGSRGAATAMCGGRAGPAPARPAPVGMLHPCACCCCTAAAGIAPPRPAGVAAPLRVVRIAALAPARLAPPPLFPCNSVQPRAPPAVA